MERSPALGSTAFRSLNAGVRPLFQIALFRYLFGLVVWLVVGIVGMVALLWVGKALGFVFGLLPASILGLPPFLFLVVMALLLAMVFSEKRLFIIKRMIAMFIVGILIATLVFILVHASPYDPVKLALGQHAADQKLVTMLRHAVGEDKPLFEQYRLYMSGLAHGNLGYSVGTDTFGTPVWDIIKLGLPQSLKLGGYALLLALYIGLPIGLLAALKQNSLVDHGSMAVMMTFYVVPVFVIAPLAQYFIGVKLGWLPVTGWGHNSKELILPVTIFALSIAGFLAKSFRSFLLEILSQDYIRTARAKGLKERTVIYLHACKNTLLPLASIVGPLIAFLVVGAFIIELFFGVPGIGNDTVNAVVNNDGPLVEGTTLLLALAVVFINMLTDIFYGLVDPRVKV